jgi:hypothetical protein
MDINETDLEREATIDATLEDTFPASDPPAWTLGREPHSSALMTASSSHPQTRTHPEVIPNEEEKRLNLLGIAGSLRRASYNRALLRAA